MIQIALLVMWANQRADDLRRMGLLVEIKVGPDEWAKRHVALQFESAVAIGMHTVWDSGEADLEVVRVETSQVTCQLTRQCQALSELDGMLEVALAELDVGDRTDWTAIGSE